MNFFTPSRLRNSIYATSSTLSDIVAILKETDEKSSIEFENGCHLYDVQAVNRALSKGFSSLLGTTDVYYGLERYCKKFGLNLDFSGCTDAEKIHMIANNRDIIYQVLDLNHI